MIESRTAAAKSGQSRSLETRLSNIGPELIFQSDCRGLVLFGFSHFLLVIGIEDGMGHRRRSRSAMTAAFHEDRHNDLWIAIWRVTNEPGVIFVFTSVVGLSSDDLGRSGFAGDVETLNTGFRPRP